MDTENQKIQQKGKQKYAELLCDFMFKRLFGSESNKDVLIDFLNMVLRDVKIVDLNFIPTEHLGLSKEDRKAVFDVSCKCDDGSHLIIEMQRGRQENFRKRALFYTSYPINEQGRLAKEAFIRDHISRDTGEEFKWDFNLKPVTVVSILNFAFDHENDWPKERCVSSYRLREDGTSELMTDVLRFVFIELGRFKKRIWELETRLDYWMYIFKYIHEMETVPEKFHTPEFKRLFILAEIGNFTADELQEYENSMGSICDYYNVIDYAVKEATEKVAAQVREQAWTEGRAEGLLEGRNEERILMAKKMMAEGLSVEVISKITGFTEQECASL